MIETFKRKIGSGLKDVDSTLIYLRGDLHEIPEYESRDGLSVSEADMTDPDVISEWIKIHNDAFGRQWGIKEYRESILEHDVYDIFETHRVEWDGETAGFGSIGVYRKNRDIGVGHYIGVKESVQGNGIGKFLSLYRYHQLRDEYGIDVAEAETKLNHKSSVALYFRFGFVPKLERSYWNTEPFATPVHRKLANRKLGSLYQEYQNTGRI